MAGTPISFVMRHENMTYPEALKYVANKYGIIVKEKELSAEEMEEHEDRESMGIVNQFAESSISLPSNTFIINYLTKKRARRLA